MNDGGKLEAHPEDRPAEPKTYTTGDLARLTGNTLRTVRHYEEQGLLAPRARESRSNRVFDADQLERLQLITDLRELSFPLSTIAELLECANDCKQPSQAAENAIAVLDETVELLRTKMHTIRRVRDHLVRTRETIEECRTCKDGYDMCNQCEVRAPAELSPVVRLLW